MGVGRLAAQSYEVISRWERLCAILTMVFAVSEIITTFAAILSVDSLLGQPSSTVEHIPEQDVINDVAYS